MKKYLVCVEDQKEKTGSLCLTFEDGEIEKIMAFCSALLAAADNDVSIYIRRYDNA